VLAREPETIGEQSGPEKSKIQEMSALSDSRHLTVGVEVPPEAQAILTHALETFGSAEKAWHWLERPNTLFAGSSPLHLLQTDATQYELVEDELTRIDHGVFV
jgi:putative toxin-antitoxin system antitoxin component (TIGR02293 family)